MCCLLKLLHIILYSEPWFTEALAHHPVATMNHGWGHSNVIITRPHSVETPASYLIIHVTLHWNTCCWHNQEVYCFFLTEPEVYVPNSMSNVITHWILQIQWVMTLTPQPSSWSTYGGDEKLSYIGVASLTLLHIIGSHSPKCCKIANFFQPFSV